MLGFLEHRLGLQVAISTITDSNGNTITNNGNGTFTDTLGVTALTIGGSASAGSPLTFTYPVALQSDNVSTATATLSYQTYNVQTNFQCSGVTEYGATSVDLVNHLTLADGETYSFTYESTLGVGCAVTGRMASVTLPTGGTISYTYSGGCNNRGINADGTPATLTRTTLDGTRTYTGTEASSTASSTSLQDEAGNQTNYQFTIANNLYYETYRQAFQGAASGTPLLDRLTCYNRAPAASCASAVLSPPIAQIDT
jgi:hypothetical protein